MQRQTLSIALTFLVLANTIGCAAYRELSSQASHPEFHPRALDAAKLTKKTRLIPVRTIDEQPVSVATHDYGTGTTNRLIVMVHGVMSDSQAWRFMLGDMARCGDVVTIDMLGCGESDKPNPAKVGPNGYSPNALAADTLKALREVLKGRSEQTRVTLVGHSLGSMVIMRMWAIDSVRNEHADVLARVDGQVLFTPVDVIIEDMPPMMVEIAEMSELEWTVASRAGIVRHRVSLAIRDGVTNPENALREEADRITEILSDPDRRRAAQAMILQAVPIDLKKRQLNYERAYEIERGYANVAVPTLIAWGERDPLFPQAMGYKMMSQIPQSRLCIMENCKHDLSTEDPTGCSALVTEFVMRVARRPCMTRGTMVAN